MNTYIFKVKAWNLTRDVIIRASNFRKAKQDLDEGWSIISVSENGTVIQKTPKRKRTK